MLLGANAMPVNNMNSQQLSLPQSSPSINSHPSGQGSAPPSFNSPAQPPMMPPPNMMGFHNPNLPPRLAFNSCLVLNTYFFLRNSFTHVESDYKKFEVLFVSSVYDFIRRF